jgi:chemotaxis protein CheX
MAQEAEVATFVSGILNYFDTSLMQAAQVGTPYLALGRPPRTMDYTGMIRITGARQGMVYFTAPKSMLSVMLMRMQENDLSHDNFLDLVGEVANTLSGNARRDFGSQFVISVPNVLHGADEQVANIPDARPIVIPIDWRNYHASLIVCLTN